MYSKVITSLQSFDTYKDVVFDYNTVLHSIKTFYILMYQNSKEEDMDMSVRFLYKF